jgi:demethylmenaquinone methyltransferase/2-methoxy-6-polyprenyl-1,4-benzoquinol methylase
MTVYDLLAPIYGFWAGLTETKAHRLAMAMVRGCPCESLLEVGIGPGTKTARLAADPGRRVCVGVDLSAKMLHRAQASIGHKPGARAVLCQADARALPFADSAFNCLLSCYTLDLLAEPDIPTVLGGFRRVLRAEGRLILVAMGQQQPVTQHVWMMLFRYIPVLVGYCRPVDASQRLRAAGWTVEIQEQVTQAGFRSDVLVARPPQSI